MNMTLDIGINGHGHGHILGCGLGLDVHRLGCQMSDISKKFNPISDKMFDSPTLQSDIKCSVPYRALGISDLAPSCA